MAAQGVLCPSCAAVADVEARECPKCGTRLSLSMEVTQIRRPHPGLPAPKIIELPGMTLDDESSAVPTSQLPALPGLGSDQTLLGDSDQDLDLSPDPRQGGTAGDRTVSVPMPAPKRPTAPPPPFNPAQAQRKVVTAGQGLRSPVIRVPPPVPTATGEHREPTEPKVPVLRREGSDVPVPAAGRRELVPTLLNGPGMGRVPPHARTLPFDPVPEAPKGRDALAGTKLGEYVVEEKVGTGGMSTVYRARQQKIGKDVAIKVLRTDVIADARDLEQLLHEARVVNAIHHPGIINIFDAGELPDGRQYLVMEYLEGESLEECLDREKLLPLTQAVPIIEDVMSALAAAHQAGVVHRDIKPANVFLVRQADGKPWVKLLDFGLARPSARREVSRVAGTPDYISPEHARGKPPGPPADIYSLGVMAFVLATGKLPFTGTNAHEVMEKHVKVAPPSPMSLDPRVPPQLNTLILRMLEKDPARRPDSVQVRAELKAIFRQLQSSGSDSNPHRVLDSGPQPMPLPLLSDSDSELKASAAQTGPMMVPLPALPVAPQAAVVPPPVGPTPRLAPVRPTLSSVTPLGEDAPRTFPWRLLVLMGLIVAGLALWWVFTVGGFEEARPTGGAGEHDALKPPSVGAVKNWSKQMPGPEPKEKLIVVQLDAGAEAEVEAGTAPAAVVADGGLPPTR